MAAFEINESVLYPTGRHVISGTIPPGMEHSPPTDPEYARGRIVAIQEVHNDRGEIEDHYDVDPDDHPGLTLSFGTDALRKLRQ